MRGRRGKGQEYICTLERQKQYKQNATWALFLLLNCDSGVQTSNKLDLTSLIISAAIVPENFLFVKKLCFNFLRLGEC